MSHHPPFPAFSWRGGAHPIALLCCGAILVTNWFLPESWIEGNPTAMVFAAIVREKLLHISSYADIWAHARTTSFPKAALFSHALTWTLMALIVVYDFLVIGLNWRLWTRYWMTSVWTPAPRKTRLSFVWGVPFLLLITWAATMMPGSMNYTANADLQSRIFFGFLSTCLFVMWHGCAWTYSIMFFAFLTRGFETLRMRVAS